jgi:hypothetical protein
MSNHPTSVNVIGVGAVGSRILRQLGPSLQATDGVLGAHDLRAERLGATSKVRVLGEHQLGEAEVVVLATPAPQVSLAGRLLEQGCHVVCTTDDLGDLRQLCDLAPLAESSGVCLVAGASVTPGLSGLLARELASRFDQVDEVHVTVHGTGGPACARQHHRALSGKAVGWHDGEWLYRPAGSGRELCWFPEPIGPRDCYRAELGDPLLLHRVFTEVERLSIRMSATRRDRLTSRLPMLSPPHDEGGIGALRVEVRGWSGGRRVTRIVGESERAAVAAAAVASALAWAAPQFPTGLVVMGDERLPTRQLLRDIAQRGVALWEFVGDDEQDAL